VEELEKLLGVPISIVSTGPDEKDTIFKEKIAF
jgi:adenylosuccinate synthase